MAYNRTDVINDKEKRRRQDAESASRSAYRQAEERARGAYSNAMNQAKAENSYSYDNDRRQEQNQRDREMHQAMVNNAVGLDRDYTPLTRREQDLSSNNTNNRVPNRSLGRGSDAQPDKVKYEYGKENSWEVDGFKPQKIESIEDALNAINDWSNAVQRVGESAMQNYQNRHGDRYYTYMETRDAQGKDHWELASIKKGVTGYAQYVVDHYDEMDQRYGEGFSKGLLEMMVNNADYIDGVKGIFDDELKGRGWDQNTVAGYEDLLNNPKFDEYAQADYSKATRLNGTYTDLYTSMTQQERGVYNTLFQEQGYGAARDYLESIKSELEARSADWQRSAVSELANESTLGSLIAEPAYNYLSAFGFVPNAINLATKGEIDRNAWYNQYTDSANMLTNSVVTTARQNAGGTGFRADAAEFIASNAISMANNVFNMAVGSVVGGAFGSGAELTDAGVRFGKVMENVSLAVMGTQAAQSQLLQGVDNGEDPAKNIIKSVIAGSLEFLTEKLSFGALSDPNLIETGIAQYLAKNMATEGFEEMISEIGNVIADYVVSGYDSDVAKSVQAYYEAAVAAKMVTGSQVDGYDFEALFDAILQAGKDIGGDVALAGLGGALSGAVFAGAGAASQTYNAYSTGNEIINESVKGRDYRDISAMINSALGANQDSAEYKLAQKLNGQIARGETLNALDLGKLYATHAENTNLTDKSARLLGNLVNEYTSGAFTTTSFNNAMKDESIINMLSKETSVSFENLNTQEEKSAALGQALSELLNTTIDSNAVLGMSGNILTNYENTDPTLRQRATEKFNDVRSNIADRFTKKNNTEEVAPTETETTVSKPTLDAEKTISTPKVEEVSAEDISTRSNTDTEVVERNTSNVERTVEQKSAPVLDERTQTQINESAAMFGDAGSEAFKNNYNNSVSTDVYFDEMAYYYGAGMESENAAFPDGANIGTNGHISLEQARAAFVAGRTDAGFVKGVNNGEEVSGNSEVRKTGLDDERGDGRVQEKQRQRNAERRSGQFREEYDGDVQEDQVKTSDLIPNGLINESHRVVSESEYSQNERLLQREAKDLGKNLVIVDSEELNVVEKGNVFPVNGFIYGNRIVVSRNGDFRSLNIGRHEMFHDLAKANPNLISEVKEYIIDKYGEENLYELFATYKKDYVWTDKSDEWIFEEIFADAFAEMNQWNGTSYKGATRFTEATRSAAKATYEFVKESVKSSMDLAIDFKEARLSVQPALKNKTEAFNNWVADMKENHPEAYRTFNMIQGLHELGNTNKINVIGVTGKKSVKDVTTVFWMPEGFKKGENGQDYYIDDTAASWNKNFRSSQEFRDVAKKVADYLETFDGAKIGLDGRPTKEIVSMREAIGMEKDGSFKVIKLNKSGKVLNSRDVRLKMSRSIMQRVIDCMPTEEISTEYSLGGRNIVLDPNAKSIEVNGGEAYRQAQVASRRALFEEDLKHWDREKRAFKDGYKPLLRRVNIGSLASDNYGAMGFLATNNKTTASGDFTTMCPNMYYNDGCWYCYRRAALESGMNNKLVGEKVWYTGEILQLKPADIDKLAAVGGLRIQSFGDWDNMYTAQLADLLYDAELVGLPVKIITKVPSLIDVMANLKAQGLGNSVYFNLSCDYTLEYAPESDVPGVHGRDPNRPYRVLPNGKTVWKRALGVAEAVEIKAKHPWVNIRIVATTQEEFIRGLRDPNVDVVTGYHGSIQYKDRIDSETGLPPVSSFATAEHQYDIVEALGDAGLPRFAFASKNGTIHGIQLIKDKLGKASATYDEAINADIRLDVIKKTKGMSVADQMLATRQAIDELVANGGGWIIAYEGKNKFQKALAQRVMDEGLQREYYQKVCCGTGRCATCVGRCGAVANAMGIKNGTNRDNGSLAFAYAQAEYTKKLKKGKYHPFYLYANEGFNSVIDILSSHVGEKLSIADVFQILESELQNKEDIGLSGISFYLNEHINEKIDVADAIDWMEEHAAKYDGTEQKSYVTNFTERWNDTAKYSVSLKSKRYMELAQNPDQNEAELSEMVREQLESKGFDSPKLYHGTQNFGFTNIDFNMSDDEFSFWTTDSMEQANTYSGSGKVSTIRTGEKGKPGIYAFYGKTDNMMEIDAKKQAYDDIKHPAEYKLAKEANLVNKFVSAMAYWDNELDKWGILSADSLENNKPFSTMAELLPDLNDNIEDSDMEEMRALAKELDKMLDDWTYDRNGNVVDFADDELDLYKETEFRSFMLTHDGENETRSTRDWAKTAKEYGYDGIIIRNVYDSDWYATYGGTGSLYVYFNEDAVRSADPVTYDDNGNIVPLEQRGSEKPDFRFSRKISSDNDLKQTNAELRKKITEVSREMRKYKDRAEKAEGQLVRTYQPTVRLSDAETLVRRFKKEFLLYLDNEHNASTQFAKSTKQMAQEFADAGTELLRTIQNADTSNLGAYTAARDKVREIAASWIDSTNRAKTNAYDEELKKIRQETHGKIQVPQNVIDNITDYKTEIQDKLMGFLTISTKSGITLENVYPNLTKINPGLFPEGNGELENMLRNIAEAYDELRPEYISYDRAVAIDIMTNYLMNEILDGNLRETAPTLADKYADEKEKNKTLERTVRNINASLENEIQRRQADMDRMRERYDKRDAKKRETNIKRDLRKSIERKFDNMARRTIHPSTAQHVPDAYLKAIASGLSSINMGSNYELVSYWDVSKGKYVDKRTFYRNAENNLGQATRHTKKTESFNELAKQLKEIANSTVLDIDFFADGEVQEKFRRIQENADVPIGMQSIEDLQNLNEFLDMLQNSIRQFNKTLTNSRYATINQFAEDIYRENMSKDARVVGGKALTLITLDTLTPEAYFGRLGASGYEIWKTMRAAQDDYIWKIKEAAEFTKQIDKLVDMHEKDTTSVTVNLGSKKVTMSRSQLMDMYVNYQRETNKKHILATKGGMKFTDMKSASKIAGTGDVSKFERTIKNAANETLEGLKSLVMDENIGTIRGIDDFEMRQAFKMLDENELKACKMMQEFLSSSTAKWGNAATLSVYGYSKFKEKTYWRANVNKDDLNSHPTEQSQQAYTVAGWGSAKEVSPEPRSALVINSIFTDFAQQIAGMANYSAWLAPQEDLKRLREYYFNPEYDAYVDPTKHESMQTVLDHVFGMRGGNYFDKLMRDISGGVQSEATYFGGFFGNWKAAAVGANVRVILQQPTAVLRAMYLIDPKYMLNGELKGTKEFAEYEAKKAINKLTKNQSEAIMQGWERALQYSAIAQWKDWGYFDLNTGKSITEILFQNNDPAVQFRDKMMQAAGTADSYGWGIIWNAVEAEMRDTNKALKPDTEEFYEACAVRFNEVIDKTQVVDGILQRSQLMRSGDSLAKMATSFMGEPTKQANMLMSAVYDLEKAKGVQKKLAWKKVGRCYGTLLLSGFINAVAQSMVDAFRHRKDDDKWMDAFIRDMFGYDKNNTIGENVKAFFFNSNTGDMLNPATYIAYIKDIVSIIEGYDVARTDVSIIADLVDATKYFMKATQKKGTDNWGSALITLGARVASLFGIPAYNLWRDIRAAYNNVAIGSDNYWLKYSMYKLEYNMNSTNKDRFMSMLYGAYLNDRESYYRMREDIIKGDYFNSSTKTTEEYIDDYIQKHLKESEDIGTTKEFDSVKTSTVWKDATEEARGTTQQIATMLDSGNIFSGQTFGNKVSYDQFSDVGMSKSDYLLYTLAIETIDENDSVNGDEFIQALKMIGASEDEIRKLWVEGGWKETSFDSKYNK